MGGGRREVKAMRRVKTERGREEEEWELGGESVKGRSRGGE